MASIYICAIIVLLIIWLCKRFIKENSEAPDARMPGPNPSLIIGNAHQLDTEKPHFSLTELAHQHGPIYKIKLFSDHWVVVNNYGLGREVFVNKGHDFSGRSKSYRNTQAVKEGRFFTMDDLTPECISLRKLTGRAVTSSGAGSKQMESVTQDMMNDLLDMWDNRNLFSHKDDIYRYSCRLVLKGIVGELVDINSSEIDRIIELEHDITSGLGADGLMLDLFPWLRFLGNKSWKCLKRAFEMSEFVYLFYKPRILESLDYGNTQSAMHAVFAEVKQGKCELAENVTHGLMCTLFGAAMGPTSTTMQVMVVVLAEHPHIQQRIQQEIETLVGKELPTVKDIGELPYTMATITEVLRNSSIGPLAIPHKAVCRTSLMGYTIPEGVNIFINLWAIHHDPDMWEDPFAYKPERFLTADGKLLEADHPRWRMVMAFGAGPRNCIGEAFARRHLFTFITSLCQRFTMKPSDEGVSVSDPRTFELEGIKLTPRRCGLHFIDRN